VLIGAVCVRPASRQELWDSAVEALQRTGKIVVDIHWAQVKPNLPYYTELGSKNCDVTRPG
jgi:hypothetical protein